MSNPMPFKKVEFLLLYMAIDKSFLISGIGETSWSEADLEGTQNYLSKVKASKHIPVERMLTLVARFYDSKRMTLMPLKVSLHWKYILALPIRKNIAEP